MNNLAPLPPPPPPTDEREPVAFINGQEVEGEDPIRRAIERASRDLLEDLAQ